MPPKAHSHVSEESPYKDEPQPISPMNQFNLDDVVELLHKQNNEIRTLHESLHSLENGMSNMIPAMPDGDSDSSTPSIASIKNGCKDPKVALLELFTGKIS